MGSTAKVSLKFSLLFHFSNPLFTEHNKVPKKFNSALFQPKTQVPSGITTDSPKSNRCTIGTFLQHQSSNFKNEYVLLPSRSLQIASLTHLTVLAHPHDFTGLLLTKNF